MTAHLWHRVIAAWHGRLPAEFLYPRAAAAAEQSDGFASAYAVISVGSHTVDIACCCFLLAAATVGCMHESQTALLPSIHASTFLLTLPTGANQSVIDSINRQPLQLHRSSITFFELTKKMLKHDKRRRTAPRKLITKPTTYHSKEIRDTIESKVEASIRNKSYKYWVR